MANPKIRQSNGKTTRRQSADRTEKQKKAAASKGASRRSASNAAVETNNALSKEAEKLEELPANAGKHHDKTAGSAGTPKKPCNDSAEANNKAIQEEGGIQVACGPLAEAQILVERTKTKDNQDLTEPQRSKLLHDCETLINKHLEGFVAVGIALRIIRDQKLYEEGGYDNFEAFCMDRWNFKRSRASQLISGAAVVESVYSCKQIDRLPCNEAQVRPLVKLGTEQRIKAWKQALKKAGTNPPTAAMVEEEVAKIQAKDRPPAGETDSKPAALPSKLMEALAKASKLLKEELPRQIRDAAVEELQQAKKGIESLADLCGVCSQQVEARIELEGKKLQQQQEVAAA